MAKTEKEEMLSTLTSRIFSAMLEDIIMDATLQSCHEVARSRALCHICNTHCGSDHSPGTSSTPTQAGPPLSRPGSPSSTDLKPPNGTGTCTPTSVKADGTVYFECLNCDRQIASNRYAPHLSSCLGLGTGTRRSAARGNAKIKPSPEGGRSVSPTSDAGVASDDSRNIKAKSKAKSKRADEAEFNLKRKRPASPQVTPNKNQKKQKTSRSPVVRVKSDPDASGITSNTHTLPMTSSQSKIPSKLREASTASFVERSSTPNSSRYSSPGVATPTSSSFSAQSPTYVGRAATNGKGKKAKAKVNAVASKRPSPPRPPPPALVQDYTIDAEGEETGSSTDTDSG